jgi:GWxTD domain-containing protein
VPFVGRLAFFAGQSNDSTLVLFTVSLPTSALEFSREGERYRATYEVVADLRSQTGPRRVVQATEIVRVVTWEETQRSEENVIFQRYFNAPPGAYHLSVSVRDAERARNSTFEKEVQVPSARAEGISTVLVVYEADARTSLSSPPRLVASPRSAGVFGRDSVILAYVETYGFATRSDLNYTVAGASGTSLTVNSAVLTRSEQITSGLLKIPVTSVGIGVARLKVWATGAVDTVETPLFMGFGDDLPVASFNDMLDHLKFFIKADRLAALRTGPEATKAAMWTELLESSDPVPSTPQHEGLLSYFDRIRQANDRFRGESNEGWLTDRGMVWVTLGPPDQLSAGTPTQVLGRSTRSIVWEYQRHALRLYFQDRTGLGRWTLEPSSSAEFNAVAQRVRAG